MRGWGITEQATIGDSPMWKRSLLVLLVVAALAATTFLLVSSRQALPSRETSGVDEPRPAQLEAPASLDAGGGSQGRRMGTRRVVATRLGNPPGLELLGLRSGRYEGKVGVSCGFAVWRGRSDPLPFILAGRTLTTGSDAVALAGRVDGCGQLADDTPGATP
ncbi:hypothetical protein [Lysobacter sp. A3-1-A15]|uniref:hypothetical protein n=1 Tax=Novilysobacter viscosus TaxID=3098602 RepID=UPI002EDB4BB6